MLRPASVAKRLLPVNLRQDEAALFSDELEREIPRTDLLEMRDVRVSPEGILFKGVRILSESFAHPWMWDEWRSDKVLRFLIRNYGLRKRLRFDKEAVWIIDNWSHGYFHWLADALSRLFAIRDRVSNQVLLLPHRYQEIEFVNASLRPFNLGGVEFMGKNNVAECRRLFVPTHTAPSGHYNEEIITGVRKLMVDYYRDAVGKAEGRFYISRGRATRRKLVNEPEIIDVLSRFGFQIVYAEDYSFAEQVRIFSAARYLVSNHGAGLTNMLFMSPATNVLELRYATDRVHNWYFILASALKLNYFYQSCEPVNCGEDPHTADLRVDAKALRANLELMIES